MLSEIYQNPRELKYITLLTGDVILINSTLSHNDVTGDLPSSAEIEGAGACTIYWQDEKWTASCHGESITLHIKSRMGFDNHLIETALARPMNYKIFRTERPVLFSESLPHNWVGSSNVCQETQGTCRITYNKAEEKIQAETQFLTDAELLSRTFNETRF